MDNPLKKIPIRRILGKLRFKNSQEAVSLATTKERNKESKDLEELFPFEINCDIKNCRYAYQHDGTIQGLILNNTFKANNKFIITFDDDNIPKIEDAKKFIEQKVKDWDLEKRMSEWLIKEQRDGKHFTQKVIKDGTIHLNELAYDGEGYDFEIIKDPNTGETLGYKQKYYINKNIENWENRSFQDLANQNKEYEEASFLPDEIIYGTLFEEDGEGMSLLMPILDDISTKMFYEMVKKSVAHKTGNLAVLTVGSNEVFTDNVASSFLDDALDNLEDRESKDAIVIPFGTNLETLGGNYNLPDLDKYIDKALSNIYIQLQTPQTLFSDDNSNRSTIEVQTDEETGFGVYLEYMRDTLRNTVEKELIDAELALHPEYKDCIGHIHMTFLKINQARQVNKEYVEVGKELQDIFIEYNLKANSSLADMVNTGNTTTTTTSGSNEPDYTPEGNIRIHGSNYHVPNGHGSPSKTKTSQILEGKPPDNISANETVDDSDKKGIVNR